MGDSAAAGARWAQQLEQQQLQRARAAPRDPAERVGVSAEFASMPTRTPVHTSTVNSAPDMWDVLHLIRFTWKVKGLLMALPGHMASNRAAEPRCDLVIRL
ncbi:hypothetical protein GCM10027074_45330 [Streptomyces deserti]